MLALAYFYAASMQDKWLKFLQLLMMTRSEGHGEDWGFGQQGQQGQRWLQLVFDMCTWPAISSSMADAKSPFSLAYILATITLLQGALGQKYYAS